MVERAGMSVVGSTPTVTSGGIIMCPGCGEPFVEGQMVQRFTVGPEVFTFCMMCAEPMKELANDTQRTSETTKVGTDD